MKVQFQCDYCEGAHPRIIERLVQTNMMQTPGYGEDEICARARELVKKACDAPNSDVHFLVGGTQTNVTCISSILKPYQGVLCASSGHIGIHETGAIEHGGHKVLPLPSEDGKISASQIEDAVKEHFDDPSFEHMVQPGMVYISYPTERGTIYSKKELEQISAVCRKYSLPLYVDGARLGYGLTCSECDLELKDFARLTDMFYIGGTKQGALFGEAVVINNDALKPYFRYYIKQNGGMLAKGRLLGIQFEELFRDSLYFDIAREANRLAEKIRVNLKRMGYKFLLDTPTNQIFVIMENSRIAKIEDKIGYEFWFNVDADHSAIRFATSWATTEENVDYLIKVLEETSMDVVRKVRDFLERNGIWYEIHFHPPLFTIEQALEYWKDIDAVHCKNLFMRNHKGNRHYMVSFECHKDLDIHSLEHSLHQGKLSFASPERMDRCLGLRPGSVSPFGLINDIGLTDNSGKAKDGVKESELFENGHRVKLYLDADLRNAERVSFHPCDNTASVVITHDGLMKFLELWGGEVEWLEITPAPTAQASASL